MKISTRKTLWGLTLVAPIMLGCLAFYAIPFAIVTRNASSWGTGYMRKEVGIQNFQDILENELFCLAFENTTRFLLMGLPLLLVIAFFIAILLKSYVSKFQGLRSVLLLPYTMPVVGTVMMLDVLFAEYGLLNQSLSILGLPVRSWLQSGNAFWTVLFLFLWKSTGYGVILLLSGLNAISEEQYDASRLTVLQQGSSLNISLCRRCGIVYISLRYFLCSTLLSAFGTFYLLAAHIPMRASICCNIL